MANKHRGECALRLGERELTLVPEFERLGEIETALGRSVVGIIKQLFETNDIPLGELATIVYYLCGKPRPKLDAIGEGILEEGYKAVVLEVAKCLATGLAGKALDEEEEKEGESEGKAEGDPS